MKTILMIFLFLFGLSAHAGKILTVKNNRVLIDMESDFYLAGDRVYAVDSAGKRRAIIEIKQVRNNRALGQVLKGRALANYSLLSPQMSAKAGGVGGKALSPNAWGVAFGYSMNSMEAKTSSSENVSMSGTSYSLKGFYQQHLGGAISVKGSVGYDSLKVQGGSYGVDIGYLGLDALVRYHIYDKSFRVWAGGGLGFLLALSKSSNIIDTSKVSTNQTILGAVGLDYALKGGSFIPIEFNYALYPSNNTTKAHQMILKFGYGFNF